MKRLNLIAEFDIYDNNSDLKKILSSQKLPLKYTIDGFDCYFYSRHLFGLFDMKVIKNGFTPNDFTVDYKNGFENGLKHLKQEEKISLSSFDNINKRDNLIGRLKTILHEREFEYGTKGLLKLVFDKVPLNFTEKNIYDYGYWNGIIYSIDNLWIQVGLKESDLKATSSNEKENLFQFENKLIPKISIEKVYNYFEILTTATNKDKIVYLTESQLVTFIKSTFIDLKPVKQDFNCIVYSKKDVRSVFYRFFTNNSKYENKLTGLKQKYFDILNNSFTGFNEADLKEFNKTNSAIEN